MALESARGTVDALLGANVPTVGDLEIDVIRYERPFYSNRVTTKKSEVGISTTNLIVNDPIGLTLGVTLTTDTLGRSWEDKWAILRAYWLSGELISVTTEFEDYLSMVISNVTPSRDASNSSVFMAEVTFSQVRLINTEIRFLPNANSEQLGTAGSGTLDQGVKSPITTTNQSLAAAGYDALFGS